MADFPTNNNNCISTTVIQIQEANTKKMEEETMLVEKLENANLSLQDQLRAEKVDQKRKFSSVDDSLAEVLATMAQFGNTNALLCKKMDQVMYIMDKFSQKTEAPLLTDLDEIDEYLRLRGIEHQWDAVFVVLAESRDSVAAKSTQMVKMAAELEKCREKCIKKSVECGVGRRIRQKLSILQSELCLVSLSLGVVSPTVNEIVQCLAVNEWMNNFKEYSESDEQITAPVKAFSWNDVLVDEAAYLASTESVCPALDSWSDSELDVTFENFSVIDRFDEWMEDFNGYFDDHKPVTKSTKAVRWNLVNVTFDDSSDESSLEQLKSTRIDYDLTDLNSYSDTECFDFPVVTDLDSFSSIGSLQFDSDALRSDALCGGAASSNQSIFCPSDMDLSFETCICSLESLEIEAEAANPELDKWMRIFADYEPSCRPNCTKC